MDFQIRFSKELGVSLEEFGLRNFTYGMGDPRKPGARILHVATQAELIKRNEDEGENYMVIANMCVVLIYNYWEDHYREAIAHELLMKNKNDLQSDIMGDLNWLRQSIIHHRGYAIKDVEKCEILKWFKDGDLIIIDKNRFEEIIIQVKDYLYNLSIASHF